MRWKYTAYPLARIFTSNSSAVRLMLTDNWDSEGPACEYWDFKDLACVDSVVLELQRSYL